MKKKLFENVGGNMFKLKMNEDLFGSDGPSGMDHRASRIHSTPFEDTIENMTPAQKADDVAIFKALDSFFKDAEKSSYTIGVARNVLKRNDIDSGLVDEYLQLEAGENFSYYDDDQV